jgi:hypothetical protein
LHSAAVLRLTGSTHAVAEIVAVAEHVATLTAAAAAFQLQPDVPAGAASHEGTPLMPLVTESNAGDAADTLSRIREWAASALRIDGAPAIWCALAHDPRLLDATWRKDRLILAAGVLDEVVKGCAALAAAQFRQSAYWISYLTQYLRTRCRLDDRGLVEVAGAVMHYISFNTIAHGMRLEAPIAGVDASDVASGGRFEHLVPGVKQRQRAK